VFQNNLLSRIQENSQRNIPQYKKLKTKVCSNTMAHSNDDTRLNESLFLALKQAGVKFVRYGSLDVASVIRSKSVPLKRLLANSSPEEVESHVVIAEVCFGGSTRYADMIVEGTHCTAESVLVLKPDLGSLRILPHARSNAMTLCSLHNQETGEASPFCTRTILKNTISRAASEMGIAFNIGTELEFCLVREQSRSNSPQSFEAVDRSLFANTITLDNHEAFVDDITQRLDGMGIEVEQLHSESAPGQIEIVLQYQENPLQLADNIVLAREAIQACAKEHGNRALFLPKVFADQAGNGMHFHVSLRDAKTNEILPLSDSSQAQSISGKTGAFMVRIRLFFSRLHVSFNYFLTQKFGSQFLSRQEGILNHMSSLMSMTLPSTNSFSRVGPGCWTGSTASWAVEDKESPLRVVRNARTRQLDHVEYKLCDSTANVYLALSAVLNAGMDGISRQLTLRPPSSKLTQSTSESLAPDLPTALEALRKDAFLINALGEKLCNSFVAIKKAEIEMTKELTLDQEIALVLSMS
jgi:glutamine synthetase